MRIDETLLAQTTQRYEQRTPEREKAVQKIRTGRIEEADTPERVEKRRKRIERMQAAETLRTVAQQPVLVAPPSTLAEPPEIVLERVMGKSNFISVRYLELGVLVARTVARIVLRNAAGQTMGYGSGFMVSPRLLLTNHHVLRTAEEAAPSWAQFNYQETGGGRGLSPVTFDLDPDAFFLTNDRLDYSLIALRPQAQDGTASSAFGWNRLVEEEGKAIVGEYVNIIQHPEGGPKQVALRENQIVDLLEEFLHYETDTSPGSSGSPVFSDAWEVVALHHSGVPRRDQQGRILAKDGSVWTDDMGEHKVDWKANEGARISLIVRDIESQAQGLPDAMRRLRDEIHEARPVAPVQPVGQPAAPVVVAMPPAGSRTATVTLPVHVSITIGEPARAGGDGATRTTITAVPGAVGESEELREALEEARRARSRPYYNEGRDRQDRDAYYPDFEDDLTPAEMFSRLSALVTEQHTTLLTYKPSRHVYPWVDVHPDRNLRSIYSGQTFDPEELIREDFRIDQERERARQAIEAQFRELFQEKTALRQARLEEAFSALEAALPYNCEHVVPQSWFDKDEPMRGDLHHLFACESGCNSFRGNTPYYDFPDFEEAIRSECGKREEHKFEPESGKGAVARATLYFLLRYPGEINSVVREYTEDRVETLLDWHRRYPVTEYERHRNMAIFEKQGNRNPLIDVPELADRIDFRLGFG